MGPVQPGGPDQPGRGLSGCRWTRTDRHAVAVQPPAGLPVQQVALHPVDGQPGGGPAALLGGDGRAGSGCPPIAGSFPWSGWSRATPSPCCGARAPYLAGHGGARAAAAAERIGRPVAEAEIVEALQLLSGRGPGPAADPGPRSGRPPPPSPGGWPSPVARSTTSSCSRWSAVIRLLRAEPGSLGVVTTVSGLLTKPGIGVWSGTPDGRPPLVGDLAAGPRRRPGSSTWSRPSTATTVRPPWSPTPSPTRGWSRPHGGRLRHRRRPALRGGERGPRSGRPRRHHRAHRGPGAAGPR